MKPNFFGNEELIELFLKELGVYNGEFSVFLNGMLIYFGIMLAFALVLYILKAVGVYKMAKTAEIKNAGLAFVPVINVLIFGKLGDKFLKRNGKKRKKLSVSLLVLNIITLLASIALIGFSVNSVIQIITNANNAVIENKEMTAEMFSSLITVVICYVLLVTSALTLAILRYITLWRIYSAFAYTNSTVYTVLSVLISFCEPIFIFVLRNKIPSFDVRDYFDSHFLMTE